MVNQPEPLYSQRPHAMPLSAWTITIDLDVETLAEIEGDLDRWEEALSRRHPEASHGAA